MSQRARSTAIPCALVVAKVVVVLAKTPMATGFRSSFVLVHLLWRSTRCTAVVLLCTIGERLFHAHRAQGGLSAAVSELWGTRDFHHALAMTLSIDLAFVVFNASFEIDRRLGEGGLRRLFFSRRAEDSTQSPKRDASA